MSTSERLRVALDALGLKITEASGASGIPYRSWQNYLRGEREPGAEALLAISARLRISADWLLTGEGPMLRDDQQPQASDPLSPRERTLLELFRALGEDQQREIQGLADDKKRLMDMEQRLEELERGRRAS